VSAVLAARRLPGLRIDVAAQPALEALPRMDIAVFVGFASTGPLHLPVVIESVTQYAEVFGPDAPLAWDAERGERVVAHLGAAVRAFFSNGGRRCWVIRVAHTAEARALRGPVAAESLSPAPEGVAVANRFAIPGVLEIGTAGYAVGAAIAVARCEGSWSDALRVSCALSKQSIGVEALAPSASPAGERYQVHTRARLRPGDLLELGNPDAVSAYAVVRAVSTAQSDAEGPYVVDIKVCAAFERLSAGSPASWPMPASPALAEVAGHDPALASLESSPDAELNALRLKFEEPMPATLAPGAWARWSGGGATVWLRMDSIERRLAANPGSPATGAEKIDACADGPAWRELGPALPAGIDPVTQASVLTLELRVVDAAERAFRLAGVGLTREHPAAWWRQTTDAEHYKPRDDTAPGEAPAVTTAEGPRFPLAAAHDAVVAWIPLGVEPLFGAAVRALPEDASALERDGLARFDRKLFLDPELATTGAGSLLEHADNIQFLRAFPRRLFGIHGALSVGRGGLFNEGTLLAIPDAVHVGWTARDLPKPEAPKPEADSRPAHWTRHRGACLEPSPLPEEPKAEDCATDWSDLCCAGTEASDVTPEPPGAEFKPDFGVFLDCATRALAKPSLFGPDSPVRTGRYRLTWSDGEPGATYVLREALRRDFNDAREVYRGTGFEYVTGTQREGVYYYQVTAELGDERSEGSKPVFVVVREEEWVALPATEFASSGEAELLAVHRAALRLAAGSGELLAVLALPRHYRARDAVRYAERLRTVQAASAADSGTLSPLERRALSYGVVYHPWIGARGAGALRVLPPDGFAAGVLAARASARGAWVAPANEVFKDAVALAPPIPDADWQALQDAQINLVRQDARGFLAMSADTLAHANDIDLRPINVRRLLILLRRLALRRGASYVFEPNGPLLRRAVQRSFTELLDQLFRRGAFAGSIPAQSFRVVTDDTINTPRDADAGRLIVELRVAPSVPMRFLSVLLAQSGERLTVAEEL
jgi:hypothetical protein